MAPRLHKRRRSAQGAPLTPEKERASRTLRLGGASRSAFPATPDIREPNERVPASYARLGHLGISLQTAQTRPTACRRFRSSSLDTFLTPFRLCGIQRKKRVRQERWRPEQGIEPLPIASRAASVSPRQSVADRGRFEMRSCQLIDPYTVSTSRVPIHGTVCPIPGRCFGPLVIAGVIRPQE